jgi:hypothetical protein
MDLDYAVVLLKMKKHQKKYYDCTLKNDISGAKTHAEIIHELSVVLVQSTEQMERENGNRMPITIR